MGFITKAAVAALLQIPLANAQTPTCATVLKPSYSAPVVGAGYTAQLIATGLKKPRGILFDQDGGLLVVQQGTGIQRLTFTDSGGTCLAVKDSKPLINDSSLGINHGIELSADGKTLYASSADMVYSWDYDAAGVKVGPIRVLVNNMSNSDHTSRTLLLSRKSEGTLLVSRGSSENMDMEAQQLSSGHSQIRAFDIKNLPNGGKPYDYSSGGKLLGWGLRNSVGVAEEPLTGGIFSVENSADSIERNGQDIHQDDPGEEMNFHGFLNGSTDHQGVNYGYPDCFALWGINIPDKGDMVVGSQFALDPNDQLNDKTCADKYVAPTLTFQAHMAPLDIKFTPNGTEAYVTFHGSWNRNDPVGYKLSVISFANGQPVEPPTSTSAAKDILSNPDLSACPGKCFRPVGLAIDSQGRIFMSSDSTGEIYVLRKSEMTALGGGGGGSGGGSTTGSGSGGTTTPNIGPRSGRYRASEGAWMAAAAAVLGLVGGMVMVAI